MERGNTLLKEASLLVMVELLVRLTKSRRLRRVRFSHIVAHQCALGGV